ncbi:MAG: hypothetical protein JW724_06170 [Candidatus Altiarchaeota archaeon]|nr:hypothetical protein [Candidatus Altiarchaeota archaeon]
MIEHNVLKHLGVSKDVAETALEFTVRDVLCDYFNVHECDVDVDVGSKTATLFFEVPQKMELEEAEAIDPAINFCDSLPVTLDFASLPGSVVKGCKLLFPRVLDEMKALETYKLWASRVHTAVEGVIVDVAENGSWVEVDLSGQAGIMRREEWIPKEAGRYRKGRVFFFYVLQATLKKGIVQVFLSRRSINLPAAILEQRVPWMKFFCRKRIAGHKSWVHKGSMEQLPRKTLYDVEQDLGGERIELLHFPA